MKGRVAALALGMILAYPTAVNAAPASVHITGGGTVVATCTTAPLLWPNLAGPAAGPACLGSATGVVEGRTPANVVIDWHADHAAVPCAAPCGDFAATVVTYFDLCASGVISELGIATGSVSITGEADSDALVETLHVDYALTRVGANFTTTLTAGFIDMDGDSPGAPDLDSDVAFHDPLGLSGNATGVFTAPAPPPTCIAPAPVPVSATSVAEFRGV